VGQGYKTVKDPSIYVKFRAKDDDVFFLAWTTTPWTLISNAALAVNRDYTYAEVESGGERVILAEKLVEKVFGDEQYTVISTLKGVELLGREYEPLYAFEPPAKKSHFIIHADFVSLEDGTGIVH
jgi:isoleucyl-tRNA synthetase